MTQNKVRKSSSIISTIRGALSFTRKDEGSPAGSLGTPLIRSDPVPMCFRRPQSSHGCPAVSNPTSFTLRSHAMDDRRDLLEEEEAMFGGFRPKEEALRGSSGFCISSLSFSPQLVAMNGDLSPSERWDDYDDYDQYNNNNINGDDDDDDDSKCKFHVHTEEPPAGTRKRVEEWIKTQMPTVKPAAS
ncbi:hypothetical protein DPX39_040025600 [Trypanosoma brucei equiperdum]|uniref:Uncharacterized protein n=1 Tax=Trypanosoma brucei equiperdum TaxID=630700 RepID=A0A3L6LCM9_9TRYP|nr:hypothetical protein DPX39_040025600 [Trypanosoma brucei equiperdum]